MPWPLGGCSQSLTAWEGEAEKGFPAFWPLNVRAMGETCSVPRVAWFDRSERDKRPPRSARTLMSASPMRPL